MHRLIGLIKNNVVIMLKRIIMVFTFLNSLTACSSAPNGDTEDFMQELEGMTLEEAVEHIKDEFERFQQYLDFYSNFSSPFSTEVKVYEEDEESYEDLPEFLSPEVIEPLYTEYFPQLVLNQRFDHPRTQVRVETKDFFVSKPGPLEFRVKEIYYSDATIDSTEQTFSNTLVLTPAKAVDSIRLVACYSYDTGYDEYKVKDKLDIPGGKIQINRIKGNMVEIEMIGTAKKYEKIIAINQNNKALSFSSSSFGGKDDDEVIKLYAAAYRKFVKKIDGFKSIDELKNSYRNMLVKLPTFFSDNSKIYTGYYKGNVNSVIVYIPQQTVNKEIELTVVNQECYPELIFAYDYESENYGFIDKMGDFIIPPVYPELIQINNFYYYIKGEAEDENTLYYLDVKKQQLEEMPEVEEVCAENSSCISILRGNKYALWNFDGKNVTGYVYDYISSLGGTEMLLVRKDGMYGFIDSSGRVVVPLIYSNIDDFSDGYAVAYKQSREKILIDTQGKFILDLSRYDEVKKVTEGLLAVCKNELWGFIDIKGKVVIPFTYERVNEFSHGVTLAQKDRYYGLINKDGEIIVPITSSSFSINTHSNKREYSLNGIKYDHYGRKISGDRD